MSGCRAGVGPSAFLLCRVDAVSGLRLTRAVSRGLAFPTPTWRLTRTVVRDVLAQVLGHRRPTPAPPRRPRPLRKVGGELSETAGAGQVNSFGGLFLCSEERGDRFGAQAGLLLADGPW